MLLLHLDVRMTSRAEHYLVRPVDRGTLVQDTKNTVVAVTRGAGGGILVGALQGHTVNASSELEGRLLVTPSAVDPLKCFFVRQGRDVRMTFQAPQRFVDRIVQFLPTKMDYFFFTLFRFPVSRFFVTGNTGRILDCRQKRPGEENENQT
jgi:hypothetical protein